MTYELDLIIDPHDLPLLLAAHLKITIARQVDKDAPQVIWRTFDPLEANKVTWINEYGIYASSQPKSEGGVIITTFTDQYPAKDNVVYTLNPDGTFSESLNQPPPGAGVFAVANRIPSDRYPSMNFGLEQKAIINGTQAPPSPLNAVLVPSQFDAQFIPQNILYVWMQAPYESGTIVGHVFGRWIEVAYPDGTTKQVLKYNHNLGKFEIVQP